MAKRKKTKFLRLGYTQYSKLGLRRKNKQKYRRAKGGENKFRLKMKGHLRNVSIGFRNEKKTRGLVKGLKGVLIHNLDELKQIGKNEIAIVAHIGDKKKKEICEYAIKNNLRLSNINPKKFLENIEKKLNEAKEEKTKREEKKKIKEKKAKEASEKKEANVQSSSADELATSIKHESNTKQNIEEIKK
ncbi:MAG: eL32 family ribosomal protein [Candidatus Nanoarchaeia archaeon]|nr:eL32 family ribosomal protein [Candidatus Nanoarchaeia archaeon]